MGPKNHSRNWGGGLETLLLLPSLPPLPGEAGTHPPSAHKLPSPASCRRGGLDDMYSPPPGHAFFLGEGRGHPLARTRSCQRHANCLNVPLLHLRPPLFLGGGGCRPLWTQSHRPIGYHDALIVSLPPPPGPRIYVVGVAGTPVPNTRVRPCLFAVSQGKITAKKCAA